jgi:hypothetical protein
MTSVEQRLANIERFLFDREAENSLWKALVALGSKLKGDLDAVPLSVQRHYAIAQNLLGESVHGLVTKELAAYGALRYSGVWRAPETYKVNAICTHNGSLWLALTDSSAVRPGTAPGVWRLIAKGGMGSKIQ